MGSELPGRGVAFALGLSVAACAAAAPAGAPPPGPEAAPDRADSAASVTRALDDFHDAAARADEARYFAHFDGDGVFLGTDATERWDTAAFRAYAHPYFARGKAWTMRAKRRAIALSDDGRTAWFDEDLDTERLGPARGSGVLVWRRGGWKIIQYNLAITVPNERFGAVHALLEAGAPATAAPPGGDPGADRGRGRVNGQSLQSN